MTIRGQHGYLIACVSTAMPEALRRNLADRLTACFDLDPVRNIDSSLTSNGQSTFEALHFSWYNRHCTTVRTLQNTLFSCHNSYATQGHDAPVDVQPAMLKRSGCSRTNYNQFIPYTSKDVTDHSAVYQSVKTILRDVFIWLAEKVRTVRTTAYHHLTGHSIA